MNNGSSTVKFDSGKPDVVYRYFVCEPKHGVMTSPANITLLPGGALPGMQPIPNPAKMPGTTPGMAGLSLDGTMINSPPPGMRKESMAAVSPVDMQGMTFEQQMDMAMFGGPPTTADSIEEAYTDEPEVLQGSNIFHRGVSVTCMIIPPVRRNIHVIDIAVLTKCDRVWCLHCAAPQFNPLTMLAISSDDLVVYKELWSRANPTSLKTLSAAPAVKFFRLSGLKVSLFSYPKMRVF